MNERIKKLLPYVLVLISFCVIVILLVIVIDSWILPSLIHNKDVVKVPDVTGKQIAEAERLITIEGLELGKVNEQFSEKVAQGIVMNQVPKAGQAVKKGRTVYLTVSKGMEFVSVPYLIGKDRRSAFILLKNIGLTMVEEYSNSDVFGNDTVISQRVLSGKNVPYGTNINVVISKGAETSVKVPLILHKKLEDVASILSESELELGTITYKEDGTFLPNTVISQNPAAGTLLSKNSKVDVVVSK